VFLGRITRGAAIKLRPLSSRSRVVIAAVMVCAIAGAPAVSHAASPTVGPGDRVTATLRQLQPYGDLVRVGNFPGGAALTPDGRFYWTISAGYAVNGVQIVSMRTHRVVQVVPLPGASGGVAFDGEHHLAYVSGEPDTDIGQWKTPSGTPGQDGDVVHVLRWSSDTGEATPVDVIPVPPPDDAPALDGFPPSVPPERRSWPERLAVSPDGGTLLVALGLADRAAVIDTASKSVRYVATGSHPYGAAILADGRTGLVTNRGPGTVSVIDLPTATKTRDIEVGPHLSHPEAISLDPVRHRAYVPLTNDDAVSVIDTDRLALTQTLSVAVPQGPAGAPVATAVTPDRRQLLVALSAADEISVYGLDGNGDPSGLLGRIPTADYPTDVTASGSCADGSPPKPGRQCATLIWTAAKGFGLGPNAGTPPTSQYFDVPPELTTKGLVTGYAGIAAVPGQAQLQKLTTTAAAQLRPINAQQAPPDTPLRPGGPIKHVFYVVRENRTYDQVLGDDTRGDGDPRYAIFGRDVTPNVHSLVRRFPLFDRFYADSEASIDGHYWTAAANNSDYVHRTWRQNYSGRRYPTDAWFFQIAYPQNGFIFDRADEQGVSWINLGEGVAHLAPLPDRDRNAADEAGVLRRYSKSDLGALTPGGCYDPFIGTDDVAGAAGVPIRLYDSSKPSGAPEPSLSRFDCFAKRFLDWQLTGTLPQLVYMTLPNDHTNGAAPKHHSPRAMVADNDLGLGQVVDLISHSPYWKDSAIFVVEDDSQDGMDHQDAHRIPALVISPYTRPGAVVHTSYDFLSMIRSIELILGLRPLNLYDASATPMYDAFAGQPLNAAPFAANPAGYPLLEENPSQPMSRSAQLAARHDTTIPDHIAQQLLDRVLWESVHGAGSPPPPPGPNAEPGE
jgi:DNA-binding beta-propeller fold protein YncE